MNEDMIYVADLQKLMSSWQERMESPVQPSAYKDALSECIYDLNNLILRAIEDELTYQDFLDMEADSYLSSMEAHEKAA